MNVKSMATMRNCHSLVICALLLFESLSSIDATLCTSCSSEVDPKCSAANYTESTKECFGVNPCAVAIVTATGHTFRGCSSDPECYGNDLCETCDGDGCNSGTFPVDRMSCLQCSSNGVDSQRCQVVTSEQGLGADCTLYFQNDACVTIFRDFEPVLRGCMSDLDEDLRSLCEDGSEECAVCDEKDCNTANVREDEQCLQCDSQDRGCDYATYEASLCAKVSSGKCYSKNLDDGTVQRGCFHELSTEEATSCNSSKCIVCSGSGCNTKVFVAKNDFKCKSCHSSQTAACVRDPYTVVDKKCPLNDTTCATVLISATGHLYRGCSTDAECVAEGDACVKCDEYQNCNFYRYPSDRLDCNVCETTANANCATLPYYRQFEKPCLRHVAGDDCVTIFEGFRVVRRECRSGLSASDLLKCNPGSGRECVACSGKGCNKITVRQDDSCLQCSSEDALNCSNGKRASAVCKKSSDGVCFNRLDRNGTLHRGCLSDLSFEEQQTCLDADDKSCETCSGSGCNNNIFPSDVLQCVQCDSLMYMDCVQSQNQSTSTFVSPCRKHVFGDKCYTRLRADGSIERGCQSSLLDSCGALQNDACAFCEGTACNTEIYPQGRRSCFLCDGRYDLTCGLEQTRWEDAKVCLRFRSQDQCYTLLQNGKVKRGCTSEYEIDVCHGLERTQCQTCNSDSCNNFSEIRLRSAGWVVQTRMMLIVVGLFFSILVWMAHVDFQNVIL